MSSAPKPRPKYYEFNLLHHWPPAVLSIFHRITGLLLFFPVLPALLYAMQASLGSEAGYAQCRALLAHPLARLVAVGIAWAYAHHFFAGIRYLLLDMHVGSSKSAARASAIAVFALEALATALVAWSLW